MKVFMESIHCIKLITIFSWKKNEVGFVCLFKKYIKIIVKRIVMIEKWFVTSDIHENETIIDSLIALLDKTKDFDRLFICGDLTYTLVISFFVIFILIIDLIIFFCFVIFYFFFFFFSFSFKEKVFKIVYFLLSHLFIYINVEVNFKIRSLKRGNFDLNAFCIFT